ncbi:MAG: hypothetical protein JXR22_10940 [Prolixibacteraceae bacterium]|nr:hypothetical protein [Prolixibacteraceae bacterium]
MKALVKGFILMCLGLLCLNVHAQEPDTVVWADSIETAPAKVHLPRKATIYSAVLPGLGQIYNKKWWKVPFIYGGFAAIGYYINDNHQRYKTYVQAYLDLDDGDPLTNSYQALYEDPIDEANPPSNWQATYKSYITNYSRQRDLYIIGAVAFYLVNILDANVNAHFIDFDVSEDLSFKFDPLPSDPMTNTPLPGVTLVYKF